MMQEVRRSTRLENRVELATVLDDFPGPGEARRDHETVSGPELPAFALVAGHDHGARDQMAEFVFRVLHAPLAARARPDAREELFAAVGEVIPHRVLGVARQQALGWG